MDLEDANVFQLYEKIERYYSRGEHDKFINKFKSYLNIPGLGISKIMMYKYVFALIDTNQIEEALKILKIVFSDKDFLEKDKESDKKLYLIGRMLYDKSYYDEAKIVFEKYLELVLDADVKYIKSVKRFLREIRRHKEGYFNKILAEKYLENNDIEPGLIVFLNHYSNISLRTRGDIIKRPYLIWKVEGEQVFAFPLTSINLSNNCFYISKDDSPKFLDAEIVNFRISDIETIYRKVNPKILGETLEKQYYRYCHNHEKNAFVLEYEKNFNINLYDIIIVSDGNNNQKSCLITDIDEKNKVYKVRKIYTEDKKYKALSEQEETIGFNEFIYMRISFEKFFSTSRNNLFDSSDISRYLYITDNSLMMIEYQGSNYIVLEIVDGYYICLENNTSSESLYYISELENIKFVKLIDISFVKERMKKIIVNNLIEKSDTVKLERKIVEKP